jgi:hypothetical protein
MQQRKQIIPLIILALLYHFKLLHTINDCLKFFHSSSIPGLQPNHIILLFVWNYSLRTGYLFRLIIKLSVAHLLPDQYQPCGQINDTGRLTKSCYRRWDKVLLLEVDKVLLLEVDKVLLSEGTKSSDWGEVKSCYCRWTKSCYRKLMHTKSHLCNVTKSSKFYGPKSNINANKSPATMPRSLNNYNAW